MILKATDYLILFIGFLLGIPASMIATLLLGPILEKLTGFSLIKFLAQIQPKYMRHPAFDGNWIQKWSTSSNNFPRTNESDIKIYCFIDILAAEFTSTTQSGEIIDYRAIGKIVDKHFIIGTWYDRRRAGGYHGTFQLFLSGELSKAEGTWAGFSSGGGFRNDEWIWQRQQRVEAG